MATPKQEKLSCPIPYTESELNEIGLRIAQETGDLARIEFDKKASADAFKKRIEEKQSKIAALCHDRIRGYHLEEVTCDVVFDFRDSKKRWVRTDTGEIARETVLLESERQLAIAGMEQLGGGGEVEAEASPA